MRPMRSIARNISIQAQRRAWFMQEKSKKIDALSGMCSDTSEHTTICENSETSREDKNNEKY